MAKTLCEVSPNYEDMVLTAASKANLDNFIVFKVYNLIKSKKDVIRVQKASEIVELALKKEDVVVVSIYEKAFDLVDEETQKLWIENALAQVFYDTEKERVIIGKEPSITVPLGMYHAYKDTIIEKLELAALTLQQIQEQEKEEAQAKKANKKGKQFNK